MILITILKYIVFKHIHKIVLNLSMCPALGYILNITYQLKSIIKI